MTVLQKLKKHGRLELSLLLTVMAIFCFALSVIRYFVTDTKIFLFLNWNLFLAFIPWLTSSIVMIHSRYREQKIITSGMLFIWILFFPNAPYLLTDLFHLRLRSSAPIWFDLILILSFAWTGLMYGFVSLLDIERLLENNFSKRVADISTVILLFLGSFGIYLGRYLRWNSWDIMQDPINLLYDIGERFVNPLAHPRTWGVTILMGLLLNIMFWSIKLIRRDDSNA